MTVVVVCLDGLDPDYLEVNDTPGWDGIADQGNAGECRCLVPSLTNVNNVSIVTGSFPETHGITGNTYYDRDRDERVYMEGPSFLQCETRLQEAAANGASVIALVAKDKLRRMVGQGCEIAVSAEEPPDWLEAAVGPAPDIYSGNASRWLISAAQHVLDEYAPDLLYVSTTDVVPHKHAPADAQARGWVQALDEGLATLASQSDSIVATADHGMNHKSVCVDLTKVLENEGVSAEIVRLIRDRHTYHHQNLGGAAYVYLSLNDPEDIEWLETVDGIDEVLTRTEAATRFRLPRDRIGDTMVLGTTASVFGPVDTANETHAAVDLRSHGSHHEQIVPYVSNRDVSLDYNLDAFDSLGVT